MMAGNRMTRNMTRSSSILLWVFFVAAGAAGMAHATPREATLKLLAELSEGREAADVRIVVNDGRGGPVRIGEELLYRFESSGPGYLTAVHVDTHGALTLLYPRADIHEGQIGSDQPVLLPSSVDPFRLAAQPPVGRDVVYAFVTDEPLTRKDLGIESRDVVVSFEPHQSADFARKLRSVLEARPAEAYRVAHVEQQVDGRGDVQYRSADIARFFSERTRSIKPAKLDLQIQFATDSVELDRTAQRNVDEFARALEDPRLRDMRFKVAGHTDDRGSESHNMALSRRRAETVRRYLIEHGGIEPDRLEIEAHGEADPLMPEESDYARKMNRRVEFMPIR